MDPNTTLKRFLKALDMGDKAEAREAYADLTGWLERGGTTPAVTGGQLQNFMGAALREMNS